MSDNQNPKALSGLKKTWENPKARKGMILSAVVVGIVLLITGMSMRNKSGGPASGIPASAQLSAPPPVKADVTANVTPQYQQMVVAKDGERAAAAAKSDLDMALPQVAGLSQIKSPPKPEPVMSAAVAAPAVPSQNAAATAQLTSQSDMQARQQMEAAIRANPAYNIAGAFMTSSAQQFNSSQRTTFGIIAAPAKLGNPDGKSGPVIGSGGTAVAAAPGIAAPITPAKVIVGAGQALYATMDTAINSDYTGPVVATVRQGPYSGAKLIGTKGLEYDAVVLKFSVMSLPTGGTAIPIQAYAINLGDISKFGTTGLQGSTDYHVMQRYVLPALLAFGQSYGFAASVNGSTSTTTATSTTNATSSLSDKDRALVALGGALGPIAADLQKQASRPVTIRMDANTEVGILFTQDVTDKNAQEAADKAAQGVNIGIPAQTPANNSPGSVPISRVTASSVMSNPNGYPATPTTSATYSNNSAFKPVGP